MDFLQFWRNTLDPSIKKFSDLAMDHPGQDFSYGILPTALLWPIKDHIRFNSPQATMALEQVCGPESVSIAAIMTRWDDDELCASQEFSLSVRSDPALQRATKDLLLFFDASKMLTEHLVGSYATSAPDVIEQIQAAIVNVAGVLEIHDLNLSINLPEKPFVPPPPIPSRPIATQQFVGRMKEISYYSGMLDQHGLALIVGMAGIGKTALASTLAANSAPQNKLFWHTFRAGQGIDTLVTMLAGFLAFHGDGEVWEIIKVTELRDGVMPDPETMLNYLVQKLSGRQYLICLDDLHLVENDPLIQAFVSRIRPLLFSGKLKMIITSRRAPTYEQTIKFEPLSGLTEEDLHQFLKVNSVVLSEELLSILHRQTAGNATLLMLARNALAVSQKPARLISRLTDQTNVEQFLIDQVDELLSESEQQVMGVIASLGGYPADRTLLEKLMATMGVKRRDTRRSTNKLETRFLLQTTEVEGKKAFVQHAILQEFYAETLEDDELLPVHQRAAAHFEFESPHIYRACFHHYRGQESGEAIRLMDEKINDLINRGDARAASNLISQIQQEPRLNESNQIKLLASQGQLLGFLGEPQRALADLESAIAKLRLLPAGDPMAQREPEICHRLAVQLEQSDPSAALEWIDRGLTQVENSSIVKSQLLLQKGIIQINLNQVEAAESIMNEIQAAQQPSDRGSALNSQLLAQKGVVHFQRGDFQNALKFGEEALQLAENNKDIKCTLEIMAYVSICLFHTGKTDEAFSMLDEAADLAANMGDANSLISLKGNFGLLLDDIGRYEQAIDILMQVEELADENEALFFRSIAQLSMARLFIKVDNDDSFLATLQKFEESGLVEHQQFFQTHHLQLTARQMLLEGDEIAALDAAEQALAAARERQDRSQIANSYRVIGGIHENTGDSIKAAEFFKKCRDHLPPNRTAEISEIDEILARLAAGSTLNS